jgi:LysM repeat protein
MLNNFIAMNTSNPFQIPSCLQANLQQRRRERFKKCVLVVVAGTTILLAVLLILGCNSEHAKAASAMAVATDDATAASATSVAASATEPSPDSIQTSPAPSPIAALAMAPVVSKEGATAAASRTAAIYVVKPADTLGRIAKIHGTTVNALKAVNGLGTDRIGIGMKLKLPEA